MSQSRERRAKTQNGSTRVANRGDFEQDEARQLHPLLKLQRIAGNRAVLHLLGAGGLRSKLRAGPQYDPHEREANSLASRVVPTSGLTVQRKCAACSAGAPCSECADEERPPVQRKAGSEPLSSTGLSIQRAPAVDAGAQTISPVEPAAAPAAAQARSLIVEDEATELQSGQVRQSEFLSQLKQAVCSTADEALRSAGRTIQGCPYIEQWFTHLADKSSQYVERALRKYAPEAAEAATAKDYIPPVCNRVRRGVETWISTGEITGVPEELAGALSGAGGMIGQALSSLVGGIGSAISGLVSGVGSLLSSVGSIFKKEHPGAGESNVADAGAVRAQLRGGHSLDAGVQARMGAAFGQDFSGVRVHTDAGAADLSEGLGARAFTVGSDIAFGVGEYQPGTLVGDALIAHELAHVLQQQGGGSAQQSKGNDGHDSLEEDADVSAVGAVVSAWGGVKGALGEIGRNALPRLRSGLRLQSCKKEYVTNLGAGVESLSSGAPPMAPDVTEAQADAVLSSYGLLSRVTKLAPPSNGYDCHGFTFTGGDVWINDDQVEAILHDNGYSITTTPAVGDIVIYRNGGAITHSGIITAVAGGAVTRVESKWGRLGRYSHAPDDVPPNYGTWKAYHTNRTGGHRLHQR